MKQWIKSLIKVARLVSSDDSGSFRFGRIFYQGQTSKTSLFTPYGFYHNPPDGSLTVSYSQNGQDSNTLSMAVGGTDRYKDLPKTGVKVGNPIEGSFIDFDNDGNVSVNSPLDISIDAENNILVTADNITFNITGTSTFTIGGTSITIDSGGITVTGGDVVADGVSLKTHVHSGVQSGGSNTGQPVS